MFKLLLSFVVLGLVFASCSKDDDSEPQLGAFSESLFGNEYSLSKGFIENNGCDDDSVFHYDLTLISSSMGISYDFSHAYLTGIGNMVHFEIYAKDSAQITEGTYTCDLEETGAANTFNLSQAYVDFNATPDTSSQTYTFFDGTLQISRNGDNYVLSLTADALYTPSDSTISIEDLTELNAAEIKANYSGQLNFYDYR